MDRGTYVCWHCGLRVLPFVCTFRIRLIGDEVMHVHKCNRCIYVYILRDFRFITLLFRLLLVLIVVGDFIAKDVFRFEMHIFIIFVFVFFFFTVTDFYHIIYGYLHKSNRFNGT